MLFNSLEFIIFLAVVVLTFFLLGHFVGRKAALSFLVAASLVFYGWWNPAYLMLFGASIAGNFSLGRAIENAHREGRAKTAWHLAVFGVAANLAVLGYFKYADFFITNLNMLGADISVLHVILPLAISFFTFQQIAYIADVHQGRVEEHGLLEYALFVSFFPQLIAGPIVHHGEMMPQFKARAFQHFHIDHLVGGLAVFFLGLFKKLVIADAFGVHANRAFEAAHGGAVLSLLEAWSGGLSYTLQLYFDFSGYSDMAIGLALIFGIRLPVNFAAPLRAASIIDFWKRWHMTLSRFLRDYVYIPLGGNRMGRARRYVNLMATMLLGGLWHGAAWTFVVWGGLHGVFLVVNHAWRAAWRGLRWAPPAPVVWLGCATGWILTFTCVVVGFVFFRAESLGTAIEMLKGMAGMNGTVLPQALLEIIPWLGRWATPGTLVHLSHGTVMGLAQFCVLAAFALGLVLVGRPLQDVSPRGHVLLLIATFAFTAQSLMFQTEAVEFLYFNF